MKISRRTLLNYSLKGSALWALNFRLPLALAQSKSAGRFLVHIRTQGGMDTTLGLDPQVHDTYKTDQSQIFLEYRPDEIIKAGQLDLGPAAAPLVPFAQNLSIIRGVHMRQDIQHEPLNEFWVRASLSNSGSAFFFDAAKKFQSRVLATNRLPNVSSVTQILFANGTNATREMEDLGENDWAIMAATNNREAFDSLAREGRDVARIRNSLKEKVDGLGDVDRSVKDGASAAVFFANNAAGFAVIDLNRDVGNVGQTMDTHTAHENNHLTAQKSAWEAVAKIFEVFKSTPYADGSLFDATTFVVTSEFSRTPFLNANKGKDHNVYTNSVLVCGPSVKPGQSIGASRVATKAGFPILTRHVARPFDFSEGKALSLEQMKAFNGNNPDVKLIFPEDVMATVAEAAFGENGRGIVNGRTIKSLLKT